MEERTHEVAMPEQTASHVGVQVVIDVDLVSLHTGDEQQHPYGGGDKKRHDEEEALIFLRFGLYPVRFLANDGLLVGEQRHPNTSDAELKTPANQLQTLAP